LNGFLEGYGLILEGILPRILRRAPGQVKSNCGYFLKCSVDAELQAHELRQGGFDPVWTCVDNEQDYLKQLETFPDVILADFSIPNWSVLQPFASYGSAIWKFLSLLSLEASVKTLPWK
jgi:hypothetical protein